MDGAVSKGKQDLLQKRMASCGLREDDLLEKFIRSSGPGGQNVNKNATCVYLKHLPSELEVKSQKSRTRELNRYNGRKRMCELLEEKLLGKTAPTEVAREKARKQKLRRKRRNRAKISHSD